MRHPTLASTTLRGLQRACVSAKSVSSTRAPSAAKTKPTRPQPHPSSKTRWPWAHDLVPSRHCLALRVSV